MAVVIALKKKDPRRAKYETAIRQVLPRFQLARKCGAKSASQFSECLNVAGITSPSGNAWNEASVLKALKRLKQLGLDQGSLPFHRARAPEMPRSKEWAKESARRRNDAVVAAFLKAIEISKPSCTTVVSAKSLDEIESCT